MSPLRKVWRLVRTTARTESMAAMVEVPPNANVEAIDPADLWWMLTTNGITPECDEEIDCGISAFAGELTPERHANPPVVELLARGPFPIKAVPAEATAPNPAMATSSSPELVRRIIRLSTEWEQYEIKEFSVAVSAFAPIGSEIADDLWYTHSEIVAEPDERIPGDFTLAVELHDDRCQSLPVVSLDGQRPLPPSSFLSGWQPHSAVAAKDEAESKRVAQLVGAIPNNCYCNARAVMRSLPDYSDAVYSEGYVVTGEGELYEHGWVVRDEAIVDPTFLGKATYFPGLAFTGRSGIRAFLNNRWGSRFHGWPFHQAFGHFGSESDSFQESFRRAREFLLSGFGAEAMTCAAEVRAEMGAPWPVD